MNCKKIVLRILSLAIWMVACTDKRESLSKSIYELEISDSSSTPKGMNDLAEMYYDYATSFPQDSIASKYLYKGFMFKYLTGHFDDAIAYSKVYKEKFGKSEMYHGINLKLADIYLTNKNLPDSAIHYYLITFGKIQMSTFENRKAGSVLRQYVSSHPNSDKNPTYLYSAGKFLQLCGDMKDAIQVYDSLATTYPTFTNTPDALMAAGFICWNDLKDNVGAKKYYSLLSTKYPTNPLAKEAKMILDEHILDMTELELAEHLMKKNKEKETAQ